MLGGESPLAKPISCNFRAICVGTRPLRRRRLSGIVLALQRWRLCAVASLHMNLQHGQDGHYALLLVHIGRGAVASTFFPCGRRVPRIERSSLANGCPWRNMTRLLTTLVLSLLATANVLGCTQPDITPTLTDNEPGLSEEQKRILGGIRERYGEIALPPDPKSMPDSYWEMAKELLTSPAPGTTATPSYTVIPTLRPVRLIKAFDGDSGIAADANGEFEFRLYGIDAPERDDVSRTALETLTAGFGSDLYAEERDVDRYGRRVIVLQTADGSRSVNVEMVRQGYAYAYLDYGELDGIVAAEAEAQTNDRGIWTPAATPAWDEYWIEQDRQGRHHETYMQFIAASSPYANANTEYRRFLESLFERLKAQFDFAQAIGPYMSFRGAAATPLHFRGYLESETEVWDGNRWGPLLQVAYELMLATPAAGSIGASNRADVRRALNAHGYEVLNAGVAGGLHPHAASGQRVLARRYSQFKASNPTEGDAEFFIQQYPIIAYLIAGEPLPQPTATPTPTPIPIRGPRPTPASTATPAALELWDQGYAAGYVVGANCVSPNPRASGGPWERGYQTGFNAGRQNECEPPPKPAVTAPKVVWDCFLSRDDSRRDENGTVLSPCGWRERDGLVYKWRPEVNLFIEHPGASSLTGEFRNHAATLRGVLADLQVLLRLEGFFCPLGMFEECLKERPLHSDGINIRFVDSYGIPYTHRLLGVRRDRRRLGRREVVLEEGRYRIASRLNDKQMKYILLPNSCMFLRIFVASWRGAAAFHGAASYELTAMDRAQLWLYSNPLIKSGMSLTEVERMARYGEWTEPPA